MLIFLCKIDRSFGSVFIYRSNARYPQSGFYPRDLRVFRRQIQIESYSRVYLNTNHVWEARSLIVASWSAWPRLAGWAPRKPDRNWKSWVSSWPRTIMDWRSGRCKTAWWARHRNPEAGKKMSIAELDVNGRVLLPLGIRYELDLNDGDRLAIDQLGDGTIIIKKFANRLCRMSGWHRDLIHRDYGSFSRPY